MRFQSTPSARRATTRLLRLSNLLNNFNPRPPRGGRLPDSGRHQALEQISIHALREEGDLKLWTMVLFIPISIHALREEGDFTSCLPNPQKSTISIHALREEGDRLHQTSYQQHRHFNPRPPRGGRRSGNISGARSQNDFNPRPPRGGRHHVTRYVHLLCNYFNPRPPRGGRRNDS